MKSMEQTPFLVTSQVTGSAKMDEVVAFYRSDLAKLSWTEETSKAVINTEGAALTFMGPEGPAQLTLVAAGDVTQAKRSLRQHHSTMAASHS